MLKLIDLARKCGLLALALKHFQRRADRLSKISSGSGAASKMCCSYAPNLNSPVFRDVQHVCNQLKLDCAVELPKGRCPVKVYE